MMRLQQQKQHSWCTVVLWPRSVESYNHKIQNTLSPWAELFWGFLRDHHVIFFQSRVDWFTIHINCKCLYDVTVNKNRHAVSSFEAFELSQSVAYRTNIFTCKSANASLAYWLWMWSTTFNSKQYVMLTIHIFYGCCFLDDTTSSFGPNRIMNIETSLILSIVSRIHRIHLQQQPQPLPPFLLFVFRISPR